MIQTFIYKDLFYINSKEPFIRIFVLHKWYSSQLKFKKYKENNQKHNELKSLENNKFIIP